VEINTAKIIDLKQKRKPQKIMMRIVKGGFVPADKFAENQLREKNFKVGNVVGAVIIKLRNPKFNRLVHKIGVLCVDHIEDFSGMKAHAVIKRLQLEGNIYCDEIGIKPYSVAILDTVLKAARPLLEVFGLKLTDDGLLILRIPRSLSFESMEEHEYQDAAKQICRLIAEKYWPSCTAEQIEEMAEVMVNE